MTSWWVSWVDSGGEWTDTFEAGPVGAKNKRVNAKMIMSAESEPLADFITTAAYTSGIDEGEACKGSNGRAEKRIVPFMR